MVVVDAAHPPKEAGEKMLHDLMDRARESRRFRPEDTKDVSCNYIQEPFSAKK
jgi:hypothetical protein